VKSPAPRTIPLSLPPSDAGPRSYDIVVGPGTLDALGERLAGLVAGRRALVVADDKLPLPCVQRAEASLAGAEGEFEEITLTASERDKSLLTLERILRAADDAGLDRADAFIALGGGITGDVVGFAAAAYRRGLAVVQCPTTLLAMVDASVGGKTAVNLTTAGAAALRKNMVGAFWQPVVVIADLNALHSLDDRLLRAGLAECIKHALLSADSDADLLNWTETNLKPLLSRDAAALAELVERNVKIKSRVVAGDERETAASGQGGRALLNLGHTFAHAIEPISQLTPDGDPMNAPLLHGEAVSLGIIAAAHVARETDLLEPDEERRIRQVLSAAGLPTNIAGLPDNDTLIEAMGHDKKVSAGRLRLVLPCAGRRCKVVEDPPRDAVEAAWDAIRANA